MHPRRNSARWFVVPALILVGIFVAILGASIYFRSISSPPFYGWWFPFGWFFFIPVIFLVFLSFRFLFWRPWGCGYYGSQYSDPAMDTLKQRFARGEITKEQFDQMAMEIERH